MLHSSVLVSQFNTVGEFLRTVYAKDLESVDCVFQFFSEGPYIVHSCKGIGTIPAYALSVLILIMLLIFQLSKIVVVF